MMNTNDYNINLQRRGGSAFDFDDDSDDDLPDFMVPNTSNPEE